MLRLTIILELQAYVELNELQGNIWQETGRWVGYEENLDSATGKWGPSHVSYLTFRSLLYVRRAMSTGELQEASNVQADQTLLTVSPASSGAIIFDVAASTLSSVAERMVDELLSRNEIRSSDRDALLRALLMRRR